MTVRTAHDTLLDLIDKHAQICAAPNEIADVISFRAADAIELKQLALRVSVVNAGVARKMLVNAHAIAGAIQRDSFAPARIVRSRFLVMVFSSVLPAAADRAYSRRQPIERTPGGSR